MLLLKVHSETLSSVFQTFLLLISLSSHCSSASVNEAYIHFYFLKAVRTL